MAVFKQPRCPKCLHRKYRLWKITRRLVCGEVEVWISLERLGKCKKCGEVWAVRGWEEDVAC